MGLRHPVHHLFTEYGGVDVFFWQLSREKLVVLGQRLVNKYFLFKKSILCTVCPCVMPRIWLQCVYSLGVLQRVAVCCSVLQCVAVWCSVLQCVAVCYSVLQCVAAYGSVSTFLVCCSVL